MLKRLLLRQLLELMLLLLLLHSMVMVHHCTWAVRYMVMSGCYCYGLLRQILQLLDVMVWWDRVMLLS